MKEKWWARGSENIESFDRFLSACGGPQDRERMESHRQEWEKFLRLHTLLLYIGGCETCFPDYEEDMDKILQRGRFWPGRSKLMRGKQSRCHYNVCRLWEINHEKHDVSICTGYALSEDGCWRQHSWLKHEYYTETQHRKRIIETTEKRVAYFGFVMTNAEAEVFCENN